MQSRNTGRHESERTARGTAGTNGPSDVRRFAQAILGNPVSAVSSADSEARANREREQLEWLARISTEHERQLRRLLINEAAVRADRERLEWAAGISTDHGRMLRSLLGNEAEERDRLDRLEWLSERSNLQEADWDPDKHPRGGYPQNRGWWSPASGAPQFFAVSDKSTTGHVVLQVAPEKPDSMDWSKARFKEPGKVSNTRTDVGGGWKVETESRDGKDV